jgi:hypothetical protein
LRHVMLLMQALSAQPPARVGANPLRSSCSESRHPAICFPCPYPCRRNQVQHPTAAEGIETICHPPFVPTDACRRTQMPLACNVAEDAIVTVERRHTFTTTCRTLAAKRRSGTQGPGSTETLGTSEAYKVSWPYRVAHGAYAVHVVSPSAVSYLRNGEESATWESTMVVYQVVFVDPQRQSRVRRVGAQTRRAS